MPETLNHKSLAKHHHGRWKRRVRFNPLGIIREVGSRLRVGELSLNKLSSLSFSEAVKRGESFHKSLEIMDTPSGVKAG